jgi:hypothetical protein
MTGGRVLIAVVAAAAAVACAGRTRGQRAALQAFTESSAVLRSGPHRGRIITFAFNTACDNGVTMEVGQGAVCPIRLKREIWSDGNSGVHVLQGISDEPFDEIPEISSSDTSVVLVAANGLTVARRPGSAILRATVRNAYTFREVYVVPAIESFHWEPASATLNIGETVRLRPVARDTSGREIPAQHSLGDGYTFFGTSKPGMVRIDTAPGRRELLVRAVAPGRIGIHSNYRGRHVIGIVTVLTDSATKAIAKRSEDSVAAFAKSHLPFVRVSVVDGASGAPIARARVELPASSLAATSDVNGVALMFGARTGDSPLVVRCPWQRRTGPIAAKRNLTLLPTSDTSLSVAISRVDCVEVDSHSSSGEITGHVFSGASGRIFIPCTPFDSLSPSPGKRQAALVVVADSLLQGRPAITYDPMFVRWTGIVEGPGGDDLSLATRYKFTAIAVSEVRRAMMGDCRR